LVPLVLDSITAGVPGSIGFPPASPALERFGLKFSFGGAHISRTMMLQELLAVLANVPQHSDAPVYREAILQQNVLAKTTDSTRQKSLRHLRELYALDESIPIFVLFRALYAVDPASAGSLAIQVAWARDPLLRATSSAVLCALEGVDVDTASLAEAIEATFPRQYSELNRKKIGRNAASSWSQSGHLTGRARKIRQRIRPSTASVVMALFLGNLGGYHGGAVFSNPWCQLLDLEPASAKEMGFEAHRAGLLNLRAVGEIVDLSFPLFAYLEHACYECH